MSYRTVLCHTVPCNCTECCKACALCAALQLGLCICLSPIPLPPLVAPRCLASPPEPNSLALGGGGWGGGFPRPALQRCLALRDRPARLLPSPAPAARPAPAPTGVCSPPTSPPCSLALGGNSQGEKALPRRCQPGRKTPRINALLKSAKSAVNDAAAPALFRTGLRIFIG